MARAPRLAVAMIVGGEAPHLERALRSVYGEVHELVVLVTDASDTNAARAQRFGARIEHFDWCDDFAAARNAALEQVESEWALMLDADQWMAPGALADLKFVIRQPLPYRIHGYSVKEACWTQDQRLISVEQTTGRLLPVRPEVRYRYRIHEQAVWLPDPPATAWGRLETDAPIFHTDGYDPAGDGTAKDARNMRLLGLRLEDDPGDAEAWYYLWRQHAYMHRPAEAAEAARRALAITAPTIPLLAEHRTLLEGAATVRR